MDHIWGGIFAGDGAKILDLEFFFGASVPTFEIIGAEIIGAPCLSAPGVSTAQHGAQIAKTT